MDRRSSTKHLKTAEHHDIEAGVAAAAASKGGSANPRAKRGHAFWIAMSARTGRNLPPPGRSYPLGGWVGACQNAGSSMKKLVECIREPTSRSRPARGRLRQCSGPPQVAGPVVCRAPAAREAHAPGCRGGPSGACVEGSGMPPAFRPRPAAKVTRPHLFCSDRRSVSTGGHDVVRTARPLGEQAEARRGSVRLPRE